MSSRVFLIRHGETNWFPSGRHLSRSEVPLSKQGEEANHNARLAFVGDDKLIKPKKILRIYCSPRERCLKTVEALRLGVHSQQVFRERDVDGEREFTAPAHTECDPDGKTIEVTPWLQEWDFGDYEGLTRQEILDDWELGEKGKRSRVVAAAATASGTSRSGSNGGGVGESEKDGGTKQEPSSKHGGGGVGPAHSEPWNIWVHGCPNGEKPEQVQERVDKLISEIKSEVEKTFITWPGGQRGTQASDTPRDIVCVAHAHVLAAMALRWVDQPMSHGMRLFIEPAGVGVLQYEHEDIGEPTIVLGRKP